MGRDRKRFGPDIFAEGKKGVMAPEILEGGFLALIHFDLLNAGIAFDVENAIAGEQIGVELLGAADVEDGVGFTVKLADPGEGKAGGGMAWQIAGAKTPAAAEAKFLGKVLEDSGRVIELVIHLKGVGVVREAGGIFDVKDIVTEPLQSDDVMKVLPNNACDGAGAHEAHDNKALFFHLVREGGDGRGEEANVQRPT